MLTVWKFRLSLDVNQRLRLREGASVLSVQNQFGELCLWALVDSEAKEEWRTFGVYGTGHKIPEDKTQEYLASVQDGAYVWHIFEIVEQKEAKQP